MKQFDWNQEKNEWLRAERGVVFEEMVYHLQHGGLLDVIGHPNQETYPNQRIFIVNVEGYACLIPFAETDIGRFQKKAIEEGLPYQTPISSVLHKYINGRLVEKAS